ncbi:hypothetical protein JTB14_031420 [Gonioctena quinquepunctata]|nr:hypothetical protein JTB14_031420 [Gonioctena quinquepunctata]
MKEEIIGYKKKIRRDNFIQRMRRSSKDFEDGVENVKQTYIRNLEEKKEVIIKLNNDTQEILVRNRLSHEELEEIKVSLNKYENDMDVINKNMITSIRTLSEGNEHHKEELTRLKYDNFILRNTQKEVNYQTVTMENELTISENNHEKDLKANLIIANKMTSSSSSKCSRILFVSGSHGKDLMIEVMENMRQYICQSIRKPDANDGELTQTAISNAQELNQNNSLIFWPNNIKTLPLETFISGTKILILSSFQNPTDIIQT